MTIKHRILAHRFRVPLDLFVFRWWRHNRLRITLWGPAIATCTRKSDIELSFIHADVHGRSCKERYIACHEWRKPWWRHQMETFSALLAICAGNSPVTGEFRALSGPLLRHGNDYFRQTSQFLSWPYILLNCHMYKKKYTIIWLFIKIIPMWHI